jgi:hypothetical protein
MENLFVRQYLNDDLLSPHLGECMSGWAGGCVSELGTGRG